MDWITKIKRYLKIEQWKSMIFECSSGGMAVSTWCKQNDICAQTYYHNLKKLRKEIYDTLLHFLFNLEIFPARHRTHSVLNAAHIFYLYIWKKSSDKNTKRFSFVIFPPD